MGWWEQDREGHSFVETPDKLLWGDGPADIVGDALDAIIAEFANDLERRPTKAEIRAGLVFFLGPREDDLSFPE